MKKWLATKLLPFVQKNSDWNGKDEAIKLVKNFTLAASDGGISNEERHNLQREAYEFLARNGVI